MKRLFLGLCVLGLLNARAFAAPSKALVTRGNFVSLGWTARSKGKTTTLSVSGNTLTRTIKDVNSRKGMAADSAFAHSSEWHAGRAWPESETAILSGDQLNELVHLANIANFPGLKPSYGKAPTPQLDSFTLIASDAKFADKIWNVVCYHSGAPAAVADIKTFLSELATQKFVFDATKVTLANFVSLRMEQSGGFAGIQTLLSITPDGINYGNTRRSTEPGAEEPPTMPISVADINALIQLLNEVDFPSLVGIYQQKNLADGFNEVVTLRLQKPDGSEQSFTVSNYGDQAPAGYYKVTAFLQKLQAKYTQNAAATK